MEATGTCVSDLTRGFPDAFCVLGVGSSLLTQGRILLSLSPFRDLLACKDSVLWNWGSEDSHDDFLPGYIHSSRRHSTASGAKKVLSG